MNRNYYPQTFLEQCKYDTKKLKRLFIEQLNLDEYHEESNVV